MNVKDLREKSNIELTKEVLPELKAELFNLRFQQATGELENPARIRTIRKTIARIHTILSERKAQDKK